MIKALSIILVLVLNSAGGFGRESDFFDADLVVMIAPISIQFPVNPVAQVSASHRLYRNGSIEQGIGFLVKKSLYGSTVFDNFCGNKGFSLNTESAKTKHYPDKYTLPLS